MEAIIFILVLHWVADFIFQDEKWATNKSKAIIPLLQHTFTYSAILFGLTWVFTEDMLGSFIFAKISFITHTAVDFVTSRVVSKKFARKEYGSDIPNFGAFTIIGFDQLLHYIQLFCTWNWLFPLF